MALKRRTKVNEAFSMASMTDVIFLLLIFFMVTSTVVIPNAIKVTLPQAQKQTAAKPLTRVTIDANLNYYVAFGKQKEVQVSFDEITPFLQDSYAKEPEMFVALYAVLKSSEPLLAMVPRLVFNSSSDMPQPWSVTVKIRFSLSMVTSIESSSLFKPVSPFTIAL